MSDVPHDVIIRAVTEGDSSLPQFDHTALSAIATCPRYGVVRFGKGRLFEMEARAIPLEAGRAMHLVFAAVRLCELDNQEVAHELGKRLIPAWDVIHDDYLSRANSDQSLRTVVMEVIECSGFYDDPHDTRRTVNSLQDAAIYYVQRYPFARFPVWHNDDYSRIGVEVPFQFVIETGDTAFRYVGRIDGIHLHDGSPVIHENKTSSRLNDAWSMSFDTSHQVTGYCVAATLFTGQEVNEAVVHGITIPLPKNFDVTGIETIPLQRTPYQISEWLHWTIRGVREYTRWDDDPLSATMFTHSCNRYFRPCSLIPLCAAHTREDAERSYNEMIISRWDPLEEEATGMVSTD